MNTAPRQPLWAVQTPLSDVVCSARRRQSTSTIIVNSDRECTAIALFYSDSNPGSGQSAKKNDNVQARLVTSEITSSQCWTNKRLFALSTIST